MVPLVVLNPYLGGGLLVEYFGHRRFNPARNALISSLDSGRELDAPMTRDDRLRYQSRMDELSQSRSAIDGVKEGENKEVKTWERMQASAQPGLDVFRQPILQMRVSAQPAQVGLSRANILSGSEPPELAAKLVEARLRQELRPAMARKASRSGVEKDLALFQQLLSLQPREVVVAPLSISTTRPHAAAALQ
jgi:hypothetical protein